MPIPTTRIHHENDRPINPAGEYVLYWMIAARRTRYNFALQRACELAAELQRPLLVLEALRSDYPFASDRLHAFVIDGMRANARACARHGVTYYPYLEPSASAGRDLMTTLSARAAVVVTDRYPSFIIPSVVAAAAARSVVRLESVDGNGLIPVAEHGRAFPTARGYRSFVQRTLTSHLSEFPVEDPLATVANRPAVLPDGISARWPPADVQAPTPSLLSPLPIDHAVGETDARGGSDHATKALQDFLSRRLSRYGDDANDPDADGTSRLSPYLHFGHLSAHEVFAATMTHERWTSRKLRKVRAGSREGWWGTSPSAEHFLEQLVVWRELAFNGAEWIGQFHSYDTLPAWARATLDAHLSDPRPHVYSLAQLEAADTHDDVWNAAQNQLRREGWFHGYMRMVWGKKILEWSRHPQDALERMEVLMNKYSLDGRDPVSYLNFGWVLGRYDRPWFERPIFGSVRYMTTESAKRKFGLKAYLAKYGT